MFISQTQNILNRTNKIQQKNLCDSSETYQDAQVLNLKNNFDLFLSCPLLSSNSKPNPINCTYKTSSIFIPFALLISPSPLFYFKNSLSLTCDINLLHELSISSHSPLYCVLIDCCQINLPKVPLKSCHSTNRKCLSGFYYSLNKIQTP